VAVSIFPPGSDFDNLVGAIARSAKLASHVIANTPTEVKNSVLLRASAALVGAQRDQVLRANAVDVGTAQQRGLSSAMLDRLTIDATRLTQMSEAIEAIVAHPDPVGTIKGERLLPNGLKIARMRAPLGLIAMVYESRPNVTSDAAALCLKSGNACVLRGGSEAVRSNQAICNVFAKALEAEGLPSAAVSMLPTIDREATLALIKLDGVVDLVIPRGGEALIRFVADNARVPVIRHYKGVCHVYVDGDADFDMALNIAINSKTQRPGVCNSMETLLVDRAAAEWFLPRVIKAMKEHNVEVRGDVATRDIVADVYPATPSDFDEEYLDLVLSIAVVDGMEGALSHIRVHGTKHTEAIVTKDKAKADRFIREVDASLVLHNASTRFNDGGELGLGAEIGISTTKIHAYGPMGLMELCTWKWIGYGQGQVRE
jgi:glutamate-5-semialdehyde dehydrogenase